MRGRLSQLRAAITIAVLLALTATATAQAITVEQLLGDGWEIAGFSALTLENRSLILFKHKNKSYLVQCSVLYDVLRTKRVVTNCYEVK